MQDGAILDAIAALGVAILQRSDRVEVLPAPFSDDYSEADARANTPAKEKNVSDEPDNLVLVYLRRIDQKVETLIADMADIKHHMTSMVRQHAERRLDLATSRVGCTGWMSVWIASSAAWISLPEQRRRFCGATDNV